MSEPVLLSFVLFAYNQESFIAQAIQGAFEQTYQPLEIIISDDCSSDNTYAIMSEMVANYQGPHQVCLNRTPHNMGLSGHLNHLMTLAKGELIIIAAGDDISLPTRVAKIYATYQASGYRARSIYSNARIMDENGNQETSYLPKDHAPRLSVEAISSGAGGVLGCTQSWHRMVFDLFGPMQSTVISEDAVIPFRAALLGEVVFIPDILVLYRRHQSNIHFREAKTVDGKPELLRVLQKQSAGNVAVFETRIKDIELISQAKPIAQVVMSKISITTQKLYRDALTEYNLLREPSRFRQVVTLAKAIWGRTPLRRVVRWVSILFFPTVYLKYQQHLWEERSH